MKALDEKIAMVIAQVTTPQLALVRVICDRYDVTVERWVHAAGGHARINRMSPDEIEQVAHDLLPR